MDGHVVVEEDRRVLGQGLHRRTGHVGEELLEVGHSLVEPVHDRVKLGTEAGGQDDGLRQVRTAAQLAERLPQRLLGNRDTLQQVERGTGLLEPHDDDRHGYQDAGAGVHTPGGS